jgi:hypothetical protein
MNGGWEREKRREKCLLAFGISREKKVDRPLPRFQRLFFFFCFFCFFARVSKVKWRFYRNGHSALSPFPFFSNQVNANGSQSDEASEQ